MKPEQAFQQQVMGLATLYRWRVAHFNDSRRQVRPGVFVGDKDAAGVPDLLISRERAVFAELKQDGGRPSVVQVAWLDALVRARVECYLWTPADLQEIQKTLARRWRYLPRGDRTGKYDVRRDEQPCLVESDELKTRLWTPGSLWVGGGRADAAKLAA